MKEIKLVATDMDHTLLTEQGQIPSDFASCVHHLRTLGIAVAIASGRPLYTLKSLFPDLTDQLIFISDNGAAVAYQNEVLFQSEISSHNYQQLAQFVETKTSGLPVICALECAYVTPAAYPHFDFLKKFYTKIQVVDDLSTVTATANKFTVLFPNGDAQFYCERDFKPCYGANYSITLGDTMWIDMMNLGVNKGSAMQLMDQMLGVSTDEIMAFGDTHNDIEMLQSVKYSYVMANANLDMRQYANYIAPSNDEYGVIQILQQLIAAQHQIIA